MVWVAEGKVKIRVGHSFPLDRAPEAFALMEERKNLGKIIVTP
jgi:NADPH:quinone reductase-like Zn-dependent oxidoreductase